MSAHFSSHLNSCQITEDLKKKIKRLDYSLDMMYNMTHPHGCADSGANELHS